jgi:hypothetical protein
MSRSRHLAVSVRPAGAEWKVHWFRFAFLENGVFGSERVTRYSDRAALIRIIVSHGRCQVSASMRAERPARERIEPDAEPLRPSTLEVAHDTAAWAAPGQIEHVPKRTWLQGCRLLWPKHPVQLRREVLPKSFQLRSVLRLHTNPRTIERKYGTGTHGQVGLNGVCVRGRGARGGAGLQSGR